MKRGILVAVGIFFSATWTAFRPCAAAAADVGQLLQNMTTETAEVRMKAFKEIVALGSDGVVEVTRRLIEPQTGEAKKTEPATIARGKGRKNVERGKVEWGSAESARIEDAGARFALHGMAVSFSRPGAEKERARFVKALAGVLKSDRPAAVKKFLIEQLQIAGREDAVPALAACLNDEALAESARQALEANRTRAAVDALRKALPKAKGSLRAGIINSLGIRGDKQAVEALLADAKSDDEPVRCAALAALGRIGDDRARPVIEGALNSDSTAVKRAATEGKLLLEKK